MRRRIVSGVRGAAASHRAGNRAPLTPRPEPQRRRPLVSVRFPATTITHLSARTHESFPADFGALWSALVRSRARLFVFLALIASLSFFLFFFVFFSFSFFPFLFLSNLIIFFLYLRFLFFPFLHFLFSLPPSSFFSSSVFFFRFLRFPPSSASILQFPLLFSFYSYFLPFAFD